MILTQLMDQLLSLFLVVEFPPLRVALWILEVHSDQVLALFLVAEYPLVRVALWILEVHSDQVLALFLVAVAQSLKAEQVVVLLLRKDHQQNH
jgi:hypothetical protein